MFSKKKKKKMKEKDITSLSITSLQALIKKKKIKPEILPEPHYNMIYSKESLDDSIMIREELLGSD